MARELMSLAIDEHRAGGQALAQVRCGRSLADEGMREPVAQRAAQLARRGVDLARQALETFGRRPGLGRAVAWTPSAGDPWAREWMPWSGFERFWAQMVRYTLPEPDSGPLQVRVEPRPGGARLVVDAVQTGGAPLDLASVNARVTLPDGSQRSFDVRQSPPSVEAARRSSSRSRRVGGSRNFSSAGAFGKRRSGSRSRHRRIASWSRPGRSLR